MSVRYNGSMVYTAQCPHCHEKLSWGATDTEQRPMPDRCTMCFESLSDEDQAVMERKADESVSGHSFNLPAE